MKTLLHILTFITLFWTATAQAHFITDGQSRELHLVGAETGAQLTIRMPLTFAYGAELAGRTTPETAMQAPFLSVSHMAGTLFYRLDTDAALSDKTGFMRFILRDIRFSTEVLPRDVAVVEVPRGAKPPTGLEALHDEIAGGAMAEGYVSGLMVVITADLPNLGTSDALSIDITAPRFPLPEGLHVSSNFTDHRALATQSVAHYGFWPPQVVLSGSPLAGFVHFVWQGITHIIGGLDHVLFVLCLVLAAPNLRGLVWSVTGFTLGHSVTLSAGILGLVPKAAWFIPAVELGVALSIAVMAALVLLRRSGAMRFAFAAGLGLLHGFGFAFMLSPMLGESLALPLAGFNIGVEIGQLAIVALVYAVLAVFTTHAPKPAAALRFTAASLAILVAFSMVWERAGIVRAALSPATQTTQGA